MFGIARTGIAESRLEVVSLVSGALAILSPLQAQFGTSLPGAATITLTVIGAAVAATALVLQFLVKRRKGAEEQRRAVASSLLLPDAPTPTQVDAVEVGVHRARPELADAPYIPRDFDGRLDTELQTRRFVLLVGPRLTGKTRSAYEAVRRGLPEYRLVVPRSPAGLLPLLDGRVQVPGLAGKASVLWLDDLAGYLDAGSFDAGALEFLESSVPRVLVLGTIGDEEYVRVRTAPSLAGQRNRMVLDRAAVLTVPGGLSDAEQQSAAAVLGSRVEGPLGGAVAADAPLILGRAVPAPTPQDRAIGAPTGPAQPAPQRPGGPWVRPQAARGARLAGLLVLVALALAVLALAVPLAAIAALAAGVLAMVRGRMVGGALACVLAVALGFVGHTVWWPVTFTASASVVGGLQRADENELSDYFQSRYFACLRGQTPESLTECGVNRDAASQLALLEQRRYLACRQGGLPADICVGLLERRDGAWPVIPQR